MVLKNYGSIEFVTMYRSKCHARIISHIRKQNNILYLNRLASDFPTSFEGFLENPIRIDWLSVCLSPTPEVHARNSKFGKLESMKEIQLSLVKK